VKIEIEIIQKYFPKLSESQLKKFSELQELYKHWNEKINVISRKDIDHLMERHVLHSLAIANIIDFKKDSNIIDVGTGGGFPGIPLAIFYPGTNFLLVDSIGKKIKVVNEIASAINLNNVEAIQSRAEDVKGEFDFVVSRAVAPIKDICKWTNHLIKPGLTNLMHNGWLLLKGGDLKEEIKESNRKAVIFEISSFFKEEFFQEKQVLYISK